MSQRLQRRMHSPRFISGFTLLEIMVVIVIVGIMATVALISMGVLGRDRDMQDQAERIWAVLNQAREECELQGFDVGLRVSPTSYDFLRFDARQQLWLPIVDDDLMAMRELSPGLHMRLWLEGREVVLKDRLADELDGNGDDEITASPKANSDSASQDNQANKDKQEKKKERPPHIMILSSGDLTAFDLQFEREGGDERWHVSLQPDNKVIAERVLEAS
jgi:general secretion pathway protein H